MPLCLARTYRQADSDPETDKDTTEQEHAVAIGDCGDQDADQEEARSGQKGSASTVAIGHEVSRHRTEHCENV